MPPRASMIVMKWHRRLKADEDTRLIDKRKEKMASQPKAHPLIHRGLHRLDADRCVQNQAVILDVFPSNSPTGDLAIIQYFEWFVGEPSTQGIVPVASLAGPEWVLYSSVEEMNEHYERVDSHRSQHRLKAKATAT